MDRLNADFVKNDLDKFKNDIKFIKTNIPSNIQEILDNLSNWDYIKVLTPEDANRYSLLLSTYSLHLLVQENRLKSYINWCENNIKFIVGNNLENTPGYGFQEKDCFIRAKQEQARNLDEQKALAQTKFDTIHFISQKIEQIANRLESLNFEKRKYMKL